MKNIEKNVSSDLVVEGKVYKWHEQYITGAEIKKLAHLSNEVELYLASPEPYPDRLIADTDRVDLGRESIECFFVKQPLPYTINGVAYESDRQFVQGIVLRKQGKISADEKIYLVNKKPYEDELVLDDDWVDLSRPGTEHFISKPEQVDIVILVNGNPKPWHKRTISYDEVVKLEYPNYRPGDGKVYSVVYKKGPVQNPAGSMIEGSIVRVKQKMIFNVTETTRS